MLDKNALQLYALVAFLTSIMGYDSGPAFMFFSAISVFLLAISWCVIPNTVKITTKVLFEDQRVTNELLEKFKKDPDFNQAILYGLSLSSADFLRFVRVLVETRSKSDRIGLSEVGNMFRSKK